MKEIQLLLVDDQELFRESLEVLLETDPAIHVIGLSENGEDAVRFCETHTPDIILMDIKMPVMDGVEATVEIKTKWPNVKVIMLTTFKEIHYVIDAMKAGAEGYLLKAIHSQDLIAGIKLVHRGGTLITQGMAKILIEQIPDAHSGMDESRDAGRKLHREERPRHRDKNKYALSGRENEVLHALSQGLHNKEIAEKLYLSEGTVRNYISNIYSKLEVHDRIQAAKKALDEELI